MTKYCTKCKRTARTYELLRMTCNITFYSWCCPIYQHRHYYSFSDMMETIPIVEPSKEPLPEPQKVIPPSIWTRGELEID